MQDSHTFIDLFAGCGGISLGLNWAGWEGVFAVEHDDMAFDTLKHNLIDKKDVFPHWPEWLPKKPIDATSLLKDDQLRSRLQELKGEVTLLTGGPPCQGFSVAGARDGSDDRNDLVKVFLDIAEILTPPFLLIENVEGITRPFKSKPGESEVSVAEEAVTYLREDLGYLPFSHVVDASQYGVPQTRDRLFIFAINKKYIKYEFGHEIDVYDQTPLFDSNEEADGNAGALSVFDAMSSLRDTFLSGYNLSTDRAITVGEALADLVSDRITESPEFPKFQTCRYSEIKSSYGKVMREGVRDDEIPDSHRFTNHSDRVRKRYERIHRELEYGRVPREKLREMGTKKHRVVYLNPNEPAPTLTTSPDDFLHFSQPRIVTVREMARLQSFPDWFKFKGRYTINGPRRKHDRARVSQAGNAVPPLLAAAIGKGIEKVSQTLRKSHARAA